MITIIIAARNEEALLPKCLEALLAQDESGPVEVIVSANACTDRTVPLAREHEAAFTQKNWVLKVLDLADGGKLGALNAADQMAQGGMRVFLDADVLCEPALIRQLRGALDVETPRYATGTLSVAKTKTWVTRAYARVWTLTPFVKSGAVGAGLFAVNAAGRARWGAFPDIISDDTFVRLQFAPEERIEVRAKYHWPMVEGLHNLIKVRKRQDLGVAEVSTLFPELMQNEGKGRLQPVDLARMVLNAPVGFVVYTYVHLMARRGPKTKDWTRGR